jgi:hypothetical protein
MLQLSTRLVQGFECPECGTKAGEPCPVNGGWHARRYIVANNWLTQRNLEESYRHAADDDGLRLSDVLSK